MTNRAFGKPAIIALLSASTGHFFYHYGSSMLGALFPLIRLDISLSYLEMSYLITLSALTVTLAQLLFGPFTDRLGAKTMLLFSMILPCGGLVLAAGANSFWTLGLAQILIGIGGAAYHPAGYVLLKNHISKALRGRAMAFHSAIGLLGSALVPFGATIVAYWLSGWRSSFLLLIFPGVLASLIIGIGLPRSQATLKEPPLTDSPSVDKLKSAKVPSFIVPIIIAMLISFSRISTYRIIINFGSVYIVDIFGVDPLFASTVLTVSLVLGAGINLIGGYTVDRFGYRTSLMLSNLLAVPAILWFALTPDITHALFAIVLFSLVFFLGSAAESSYLQEIIPIKNQGTIFSVVFSIETGVATFTLVLFGVIAELFGLRLSMLMTTGITVLGIISAYFIKQSPHAPEKALES